MRARSNSLLFACCAVVLFFSPASAQAKPSVPFQGVVTSDDINVRVDATTTAVIACTVGRNERVEVISEAYGWYKIRLPRKSPAYVKQVYVQCTNLTQIPANASAVATEKPKCITGKILRNRVNVRLGPSESAPIVGMVDKDEYVSVRGEQNGFCRIEPPPNSFGWISEKFVEKATEALPVSSAQPQSPALQAQPQVQVFIGELQPYGKFFNRAATHKLLTPDKQIFLLKGDKKVLARHNNRKVRISGKRIDQASSQYPIIEVITVEDIT